MLKDIAPHVTRTLFLHHPQTAANMALLRAAEAAASPLGMTVVAAGVQDAADIERAIAAFPANGDGGLIAAPHVVIGPPAVDVVARLAARHRLPCVYPFRFWIVRNAGLMSYGVDVVDLFAMRRIMLIGFCAAQNRAISRFKIQPNTSWSST